MNNCSNYGNFRNVKFTDIFPNEETFVEECTSSKIPLMISKESLTILYYLLYSKYGNSVIASSDNNRFKYNLQSIIFQYGPTWEKKLDVQKKIRDLSEQDIVAGSKAIYNHSFNPSSEPSTSTLEELTTINEQNTTNYKRSKLEGYSMLYSMLDVDITGEFLSKFKKLFLTIVMPDLPLWYITDTEENE